MPHSADTISRQGLERCRKHTTVKIADRDQEPAAIPGSCTAGDSTGSRRTPVTAQAKSLALHRPPGAWCWLPLAIDADVAEG